MSGLYTRFNLSEQGLNSTEAVQKLYGPSIQEDINLFAFSSKLSSTVKSPDQVAGFINESISLEKRTKFVTLNYTFSDRNLVWFEEASGLPVKYSNNGSLAFLEVKGNGSGLKVSNSTGVEPTYPYQVDVQVIGKESGSRNAIVRITVQSEGKISDSVEIISSGSGYKLGEIVEPLLACGEGESPVPSKCANYGTGFSLKGSVDGHLPILIPSEYKYTVLSSSTEGFFLYDNQKLEWVNLGDEFDFFVPSTEYPVVIKRSDSFSSDNLSNLYELSSTSFIYDYYDGDSNVIYSASESLNQDLLEISDRIESIKFDFSDYIQNCRTHKLENEQDNDLGIRYNILNGQDLTCNYRLVFRDPDNTLDQISFEELRGMVLESDTKFDGKTVPGIWIFNGDKYQRIFSNDNKPFVSLSGRFYLSPRIYELDGENNPAEATTFKYSIEASFYNEVSEITRGFDTTVSTLVQNISQDPDNGGFVYYRTIAPIDLSSSSGVKSWPLISYVDAGGSIKDSGFLAI